MKEEVARLSAYPCLADCTANTIHNHKNKMTSQRKKTPPPPPREEQQQQQQQHQCVTVITSDLPQPHALLFSPIAPINRGGRPLGSTDSAKREAEKSYNKAVTHCAEQLATAIQKAKDEGTGNIGKGVLADIIRQARAKFGISDDTKTSADTVRSRVKRGKLEGKIKSPMDPVEATLVSMCTLRARMGLSLDPKEFLDIANSLVEGTETEAAMIEHKRKRGLAAESGVSVCGERYHHQFLSRHQDKIKSTKGFRKDNNRHKFSTYFMFEQMYGCIYGRLEEGGIVEKLDSPVLMNKLGDIVDTPDGAYGLPVECNLKWPHLLMFMDETGSNANQKKDGQVGRKRFIAEKRRRVELCSIASDIKWTLTPIHNARGEPALCVIVFQSEAKSIPFSWTTGIDPTVEINPDLLNTESDTWIHSALAN